MAHQLHLSLAVRIAAPSHHPGHVHSAQPASQPNAAPSQAAAAPGSGNAVKPFDLMDLLAELGQTDQTVSKAKQDVKAATTTFKDQLTQTESASNAAVTVQAGKALALAMPIPVKSGKPAKPSVNNKPDPAPNSTPNALATPFSAHHAVPILPLVFSLPAPQFLKNAAQQQQPQPSTDEVATNPSATSDPKPQQQMAVPLAFSARIHNPAEQLPNQSELAAAATNQTGRTRQERTVETAQPVHRTVEAAGNETAPEAELSADKTTAAVAAQTTAVAASRDVTAPSVATRTGPAPSAHASSATEPSAPPAAPQQPLRDVAFQVPGTRGVEVRLTERAGEVRVDVRSADPTITQELRGNLRDLVSNLERKGVSAEVSHPADATSAASRPGETGFSRNSAGSDSQEQPQEQQQQRQRQPVPEQDQPQRSSRTAWTEALETISEGFQS